MQPLHLFVTTYIKFRNRFLQLGDSCPKCDSRILQEELLPLTGHIIDMYSKLQLKCRSCQSKIADMMSHIDICKGPPVHSKSKVLLFGVKMETKIKKSLPQLHKDVEESVAKVATTQFEDETDIPFALLADHLHAKKDARKKNLWKFIDRKKNTLVPCYLMCVWT